MASKNLTSQTTNGSNSNYSNRTRASTNGSVRTAETRGISETTEQVQAALTESSTKTDSQTTTQTRTTDAGFVITFSVPLRGGIYNSGSANPPL